MTLQDVKIETGYIIIVDQLMDGLGCGNGKTHTNNVQIQTGNITYEIVKQEDMLNGICKKQLATVKDIKIETGYIIVVVVELKIILKGHIQTATDKLNNNDQIQTGNKIERYADWNL